MRCWLNLGILGGLVDAASTHPLGQFLAIMQRFVRRYSGWVVFGMVCAPAVAQFGGPAKVNVAAVEMRPLPASATLVGTVEPVTRSVVGAETGGLVATMPVRQGDFVRAGELICKLKDDTLLLQLEETRQRLKGLEAAHRKWEFEEQRIERLYGTQDAAEKEVYDTRASLDEARFAVGEWRAIVTRLETELAKTEIRAPYSGFIINRHTEVGQWVDQGGPVVEMADLSTVLIKVDLPEKSLPYVRQGDTATVMIHALGQTFAGTVRHVMLQADAAARTFPVEIAVPNPGYVEVDGRLIPRRVADPDAARVVMLAGGMFARATLQAGPATPTPAIPKDAVVMRNGVEFVCMVVPGQEEGSLMAMPVPVTTGVDVGDWIAVTSGNLAPGMRVVTQGNESILFPSPVLIVQPLGAIADADPAAPSAATSPNIQSGS